MISDLKPYVAYKESVLPWLGRVPVHWDVRPAFGAFMPNHDRNLGMKEETVLSLSYGRIIIKPPEKLHGLVPESFETYQIVNPGDIILRTTDLQNDHTSLRVGMVRNRGIITSAYLALRVTDGVTPDFGYQYLNVWDMSKAIYGYGSGLRQNLDFSHFKRMPVALPPPAEQAAIVRFLDCANGRLERAIRAKRKVIAVIGELRKCVTEDAFCLPGTKSVRLGVAAELVERAIDRQRQQVYTPIGLFNRGRGIFHKEPTKGAELGDSKFFWIEEGDLVLSGQFAWEGAIALASSQDTGCVASHRYPILHGRPEFVASAVLLAFFKTQFGALLLDLHSRGAAGRNRPLNASSLLKEKIPVPPLSAQQSIIELVLLEARLADSVRRMIQAVREYRTRLVADVVTGKLDVREAAPLLPEEADKQMVLDDTDLVSEDDVDIAETNPDAAPEETEV